MSGRSSDTVATAGRNYLPGVAGVNNLGDSGNGPEIVEYTNKVEQVLRLQNVGAEDSAILKAIVLSTYVMSSDKASAPQRSLLAVAETSDMQGYVVKVATCAAEIITADHVWALWSGFPTHIESIILCPHVEEYVASTVMQVTVCKSRNAPASSLVLQRRLFDRTTFDKENYKVLLDDVDAGREDYTRMRSIIGSPSAQEHDGASTGAAPAFADDADLTSEEREKRRLRAPWSDIADERDRSRVQRMVLMCKDMATNKGDEFWRSIVVQDEPTKYRYRMLVQWTLPDKCALDVRAVAAVQQEHLPFLENIRMRTDARVAPDSVRASIVVTFVVSKHANPLIAHRHISVLNLHEGMSTTASAAGRGYASVTVASPANASAQDPETKDPVRIALKSVSPIEPAQTSGKRGRSSSLDGAQTGSPDAIGMPFGRQPKRRKTERTKGFVSWATEVAKQYSPI